MDFYAVYWSIISVPVVSMQWCTAELYSISMAANETINPNTAVCGWSADAAPVNVDVCAVVVLDNGAGGVLDACVEAATTWPAVPTIIVVVYVLVTGDVGRTSVAPPLVRSEPYIVVVLLLPIGMMIVICPHPPPVIVLCA